MSDFGVEPREGECEIGACEGAVEMLAMTCCGMGICDYCFKETTAAHVPDQQVLAEHMEREQQQWREEQQQQDQAAAGKIPPQL
eukprot:SAG11_NODE_167_length_13647_cov_7.705049_7_plen_84_part_00